MKTKREGRELELAAGALAEEGPGLKVDREGTEAGSAWKTRGGGVEGSAGGTEEQGLLGGIGLAPLAWRASHFRVAALEAKSSTRLDKDRKSTRLNSSHSSVSRMPSSA